jgi:ABC-type sugar transport system permease subunit
MKATKQNLTAWVMISPAMIFFFLFIVYPIGKAFQISLYDYDGFNELEHFVGFANYAEAFRDADFFSAMGNNTILALWDLVIAITVAFFLAYFLFKKSFGWRVFNVALFIPTIISVVVVAVIWKAVYQPTYGLLNGALAAIGLQSWQKPWLSSPDTALFSVIVTWIWTRVPFNMLILFSGMLRIPNDLFEAAKIDGANEWNVISRIVFPVMLPMIFLLIILSISNDFRVFDLIWVMTEGGPLGSTDIATSYIYQQGFVFNNYGYANALSFIVLISLFAVVGLLMKLLKRIE